MFNKFISVVLLFAVTSVHASIGSHNGLKDAFDELNYSLSVEWDQQDVQFFTDRMGDFSQKMRDLRAQGLTNRDLIEFAKLQLKDQKTAADIDKAFSNVSVDSMSDTEVSNHIIDVIKKSYTQGANWSGAGPIVAIVLAVVLLAILGTAAYVGFAFAKKDERKIESILGFAGFQRPDILARALASDFESGN